MTLWLVSRAAPIGYDEFDSHVVRASTAEEAKRVAGQATPGDEGASVWTDPTTTATELPNEGNPCVLHSSFCARGP